MGGGRSIKREIISLIAILILFLLIFQVVIPNISGVSTPFTVVTSGSMRPTLEPGDFTIAVGCDPYQLKEGDIIVFRVPWSENMIVHRIIKIERGPDGPIFYTKGDNNLIADPGYRKPSDIYGKVLTDEKGNVVFRVPWIGYFLEVLQILPVKLALAGLIVGYLIYDYSKEMRLRSDEPQGDS
jgi:signal peptidase